MNTNHTNKNLKCMRFKASKDVFLWVNYIYLFYLVVYLLRQGFPNLCQLKYYPWDFRLMLQ